jgi:hypothetical protein
MCSSCFGRTRPGPAHDAFEEPSAEANHEEGTSRRMREQCTIRPDVTPARALLGEMRWRSGPRQVLWLLITGGRCVNNVAASSAIG